MVDSDFIMENKNKYFLNLFSFSDVNIKKLKNLMSKYGKKFVYLKVEMECLDEIDILVRFFWYI